MRLCRSISRICSIILYVFCVVCKGIFHNSKNISNSFIVHVNLNLSCFFRNRTIEVTRSKFTVTAGMTTDDPYWYHNNFSQLGDRTTFAARMFNSTLILAGTCIIIVSYFAISELVTTERLQRLWHDRTNRDPNRGYEIPHFMLRISILSFLLMVAGLAFIGIGVFRYTPHNLLHNICAKGLPFVMLLLFVLLPWLAPRLSKAVMVASDLTALVCAAFWVNMMMGHNTLTNVEALAGLAFLGWFIVFSRQIAAIEADRAAVQLLHAQAIEGGFEQPSSAPDQQIESRIAADR